ncbi:MAG: methyltransferase [Acidobacteria bacterium]|nr:methyltransferase [Acidobacteriota bacterium]
MATPRVGKDTEQLSSAMMLRELLCGFWVSQSIYVVAKLGIADLLAGGAQTCASLAERARVDAGALYRVMRTLAGYGLFEEREPQCFALTSLGRLLQTDAPMSLRSLAIWNGEMSYKAWGEASHAVETGQPTTERVLGMRLFEYLWQKPEVGQIFNDAMSGLATQVAQAVASAYDFSGTGCVVDVGGGQGTLLASILRAYPETRGILFDGEAVVEGANRRLEAMGLAERCEVVGGDFFERVPEGGDIYLLSSVLHDWDDERGLQILRNCRRAMRRNSKLLVIECVIPHSSEPCFSKLLDLQMLVVTGGRERTEEQFQTLLSAAGFELTNIIPAATPERIIEAVAI